MGEREGRIALVATARHDDRGIRVDKLTAVADIGRGQFAVPPLGAHAPERHLHFLAVHFAAPGGGLQ